MIFWVIVCVVVAVWWWSEDNGDRPISTNMQETRAGPMNELHVAAGQGSCQKIERLLSARSAHIDQGNPECATALTIAAAKGRAGAVRTLLNNGASVSAVTDQGATALHTSSLQGHQAVCELLINHGSSVEAKTRLGFTSLHLAANNGHAGVCRLLIKYGSRIGETTKEGNTALHLASKNGHTAAMTALIAAGENLDSRLPDGRTPLHLAAMEGHVQAIRVLLRAGANPLLTSRTAAGFTYVPLDTAVRHGRLKVVHELIRQFGLEGCAGASGGSEALRLAAQNDQVDIIVALAEAGVEEDSGGALFGAIGFGREAAVKVLLRLKRRANGGTRAYVNTTANLGGGRVGTPLLVAIGVARHEPHPGIVRTLIDAGADTTTARGAGGTPLDVTTRFIREMKVDGKEATVDQMQKLQAIRRILVGEETESGGVAHACWFSLGDEGSVIGISS